MPGQFLLASSHRKAVEIMLRVQITVNPRLNIALPTYGYSRMYSGVNTHTFVKHITSQSITSDGLDLIGDCVTTLATLEGLDAHRNAVSIRLRDIRK